MSRSQLRTYDPGAANAALPQVERLVRLVVETSRSLPDLDDRVKVARYQARRPEAGTQAQTELERVEWALWEAQNTVVEAVAGLEGMGVQLKDARAGLVDFLAYRDGELVELCWKLGEDSVAHWHRIGEGFRGRKPI